MQGPLTERVHEDTFLQVVRGKIGLGIGFRTTVSDYYGQIVGVYYDHDSGEEYLLFGDEKVTTKEILFQTVTVSTAPPAAEHAKLDYPKSDIIETARRTASHDLQEAIDQLVLQRHNLHPYPKEALEIVDDLFGKFFDEIMAAPPRPTSPPTIEELEEFFAGVENGKALSITSEGRQITFTTWRSDREKGQFIVAGSDGIETCIDVATITDFVVLAP